MRNRILYYGLIVPLSHLPFSVLYVLSDILFLVLYYAIGYRKKVIRENIRRSFPERSTKKLKTIEKEFFRHFADLLVESLKTFTISQKESLRRVKIVNTDVVNNLYDQGKNITTIGGHNGNWELYATACAMQVKPDVAALYTPLSSPFFDKIMRQSRSRYGLQMIPTIENDKLPTDSGSPTMFIFGIDQCPRKSQKAYWMEFLNQETGVQFGAEKFARDHNTAVVFGNIRKLKRGYYEIEYSLICEDPSTKPVGWIMESGTKRLEKMIKQQPAYWLWSHKRWKYPKEEYDQFREKKSDGVLTGSELIESQ
ncbi:MAG: lysophospholipid acyltransferase family protein [Bacteroidota bacterium]